jgi:lipid-A-disaccharide synthase
MSLAATPAAAGLATVAPAGGSLADSPPGIPSPPLGVPSLAAQSLAPAGGSLAGRSVAARSRSVADTASPGEPLRVGIVAGELSGDLLGAALITALRAQVPNAQFFGVAGPKMIAAGCEPWATADELSVMGLAEVLRHLPRLLKLRASLVERFRAARPHVFIGIDSPEFNLGLAKRLKREGIKTVQYVSPQVWAWRQGRVRTIGEACDLVLCLLPFETDFYTRYGVRAVFVGHPLADQIPLEIDRAAARRDLDIDPAAFVVALLPGSRLSEVERLGNDLATAAAWIAARRPEISFVAPMASPRVRQSFERKIAEVPNAPMIRILDGHAQRVLAAADAAIVASGTATLETLLSRRPMVVAYRFAAFTAFVLRSLGLIKVQFFSQPNLLTGRRLVPEFLQEQVNGADLGAALLNELADPEHLAELQREFRTLHETLRRGGADLAATALLELVRGDAT